MGSVTCDPFVLETTAGQNIIRVLALHRLGLKSCFCQSVISGKSGSLQASFSLSVKWNDNANRFTVGFTAIKRFITVPGKKWVRWLFCIIIILFVFHCVSACEETDVQERENGFSRDTDTWGIRDTNTSPDSPCQVLCIQQLCRVQPLYWLWEPKHLM